MARLLQPVVACLDIVIICIYNKIFADKALLNGSTR